MAAIQTRQQRESVTGGILCMLVTMMWFITLDTLAKELLANLGYSIAQVVWARFFFHFVLAAALALVFWRDRIASRHLPWQLVRSLLLLVTTVLFNAGLRTAPLATATAIMFLSPVMITALSVPILGEQVGVRRWVGVGAGLVGAFIIIRPGAEGFDGGAFFFLAAALLNAGYQLLTRRIARIDDPRTTFFYTAIAGAVAASLVAPYHWQNPAPAHWLLLLGMGATGGIGHLFLIYAFEKAPVSAVAPFAYSALVWATLAGYVFFGEVPDVWTVAGAVLIAASGLYIFHRERALAAMEKVQKSPARVSIGQVHVSDSNE
ncbi:MAG: DMT family transporter [Pseudomonadota bacterium]|nr:DMT family transporter [Pseudomonadota bacterium]